MKVIFYAPKETVFEYFKHNGEFIQNIKEQQNWLNSNLTWSLINYPKSITFSSGWGKYAGVQMFYNRKNSSHDITVLELRPSKLYLLAGALLLFFYFIGIAAFIAYFVKKRQMKNKFLMKAEPIVSKRFQLKYL